MYSKLHQSRTAAKSRAYPSRRVPSSESGRVVSPRSIQEETPNPKASSATFFPSKPQNSYGKGFVMPVTKLKDSSKSSHSNRSPKVFNENTLEELRRKREEMIEQSLKNEKVTFIPEEKG
jgi:hypothetical protein